MNENRGRWQSGYHGEDSLRDKANRMLGVERKGARYGIPDSMSSPGHTSMRPFAEGGHADGGAMRKGGRSRHRAEGGKMAEGGEPKFGWGGMFGSLGNAASSVGNFINNAQHQYSAPFRQAAQRAGVPAPGMRKGGHGKKHHYSDGGEAQGAGRDYAPGTHPGVPTSGMLKKGGRGHHYADGGLAAGGHGRHHKLSHDQSDMHLPDRSKREPIRRISKHHAENLRTGGHAGNQRLNVETVREYEHEGMRRGGHRKHHYADGGEVVPAVMQGNRPFAEGGHADGGAMRRGGHKKHHAEGGRMADGGKPKFGWGGALAGGLLGGPVGAFLGHGLFAEGGHADGGAMRRGGHKKHHAEGGHEMKRGGHGKHHYAAGGTVYEREMVGERPSHKSPRINYEADMRGERAVSKPSSRHQSKKGLHDMEHGQLFADGGHCGGGAMKRGGHKKHHAEGGATKMAMGGVGKIRHNQATSAGQPRGAKRVIRNNLF